MDSLLFLIYLLYNGKDEINKIEAYYEESFWWY